MLKNSKLNVDYVEFAYICGVFSQNSINLNFIIMFYCIYAKYIPSSRGSRDVFDVRSLFNDYSVIVPSSELYTILKVFNKEYRKQDLYMIYNSITKIVCLSTKLYLDEFSIRGLEFISSRLIDLDLKFRFNQFILRLVHDCDKAIESMDVAVSFLHDLSAGALPADLWSNYCWYRTFGYCVNVGNDVIHNTNL